MKTCEECDKAISSHEPLGMIYDAEEDDTRYWCRKCRKPYLMDFIDPIWQSGRELWIVTAKDYGK